VSHCLQSVYLEEFSVKGLMKTTIFVAITIAALGAVGITTAIISSGIPVHAQGIGGGPQTITTSGHTTITNCPSTGVICSQSGHTTSTTQFGTGVSSSTDSGNIKSGDGSGGGHASCTTSGINTGPTCSKCVGSAGFQQVVCPKQ